MAVLVSENRRDRFGAELFHFGADRRALEVSLLALEPGRYRWSLTAPDGRVRASGRISITPTTRRLALTLPSRELARLTVQRANE
jgi:hypothetical protein